MPSQFGYDSATNLSIQDVVVDDHKHPTMVQLSLKSSKTDPFWRGVQIVIRSTQDDLCPVAALLAYLAVRGGSPGPLFRFMNGLPLTRPEFVSRVKGALQSLAYPDKDFAGHSFRAGAASTAAAMGIEDSVINPWGDGRSPHIFTVYTTPSIAAERGNHSFVQRTRNLTVFTCIAFVIAFVTVVHDNYNGISSIVALSRWCVWIWVSGQEVVPQHGGVTYFGPREAGVAPGRFLLPLHPGWVRKAVWETGKRDKTNLVSFSDRAWPDWE